MISSEIRLQDILTIARRRKKYLIVGPVLVTVLSGIWSIFAPRMYESSTTILWQRMEVQNPLTTMTTSQVIEDPLQFFDEIIYSQYMLLQLIDSLQILKPGASELERRAMMDELKRNISTRTKARESFSITFFDTDPMRAKQGAEVLASLFMHSFSSAKHRSNAQTVRFYKQKLDEFGQKLDESKNKMIAAVQNRGQAGDYITNKLGMAEQAIRDVDVKMSGFKQIMQTLEGFPSAFNTSGWVQVLYEVQQRPVPYAQELRPLLSSYEDAAKRYTPNHPEVSKIQSQIQTLVERMRLGLQSEISQLDLQMAEHRRARDGALYRLMRSSVLQESDKEKESTYQLYQRLYNEMKVKMEEAQMSMSIGLDSDQQFRVVDEALVPLFPSRPNRKIIIASGFGLGLLLGIVVSIISEMFDTTIRSHREILAYHKPIVALLPERTKKG